MIAIRLFSIIVFLINTFDPIEQSDPMLTFFSIIVLWPIQQYIPIYCKAYHPLREPQHLTKYNYLEAFKLFFKLHDKYFNSETQI